MQLVQGDCLHKLKDIQTASVDLVYLDPPFFTGKTHTLKHRKSSEVYEFDDIWESVDAYINFLRERLLECQRVLKDTGTIFLHCDKSASHRLKLLMDEVFGDHNFVNEIVWTYKRWSNSRKGLMNSHQNIFFYSKTNKFTFNTIYNGYSPTTNIDQILQARKRDSENKTIYKRDAHGDIVLGKEKSGVPLSDVWDIPYLNPKAGERTGYPTQKPIILLERIINIGSNEGDLVLDPFCGSGTTLVASSLNNRDYIGIDISEKAIKLSEQRLKEQRKTKSALLEKGATAYLNKEDYVRKIIEQLDGVVVERNSGIDGFLKEHYDGSPVAIYVQRNSQSIADSYALLSKAIKSKNIKKKILVRTHASSVLFEDLIGAMSKDPQLILIDSLNYQISLKKLS